VHEVDAAANRQYAIRLGKRCPVAEQAIPNTPEPNLQSRREFRYPWRRKQSGGQGMETSSEMIRVTAPDGSMPALLARPKAPGKHPAVIVVMEAFGLNDHIKDVAKRVAAEGYVALAPDMYHREGSRVATYENLPEAIRLMSGLTDDGIVRDIGAAINCLQSHEAVKADRIGITGFCMGGRISFLAACKNGGIKASVPFYGGGIGGLLGHAHELSCPTLLFFGDKDAFIPNDEVERIQATLKKLGKPADVKVYSGAEHGFFCNERPSYNPEAAKDAWKRLLDFFGRHLGS
jgi:carboxymethylenebutenolidase